jgi:16S rRNA (guanine527-N7)-methyltransferase
MPSETLRRLLAEGQEHGFIGPADLDAHVAHAEGFGLAVERTGLVPDRAVDLGSGGGLPALVLAERWPASEWLLVEAHGRRAHHLERAIGELGWQDRVVVGHGRAETFAHDPQHRASADVVTARGFGPPPVTAECGAGFLAVGGRLVVSEPPGSNDEGSRWPAEGPAVLGLEVSLPVEEVGGIGHYRVLRQATSCPDTFPRRVGVPAKRPLF